MNRFGVWLGAALVIAGHLLLVQHFIDPDALLSTSPLRGGDYDTHVGQTYRMMRSLEHWGETWSYDVSLLAGQPAGTIFDADNKGWGFFAYGLHRMGVAPGLSFNLFAALAHLLLPLVMFTSARLFGLGTRASVIAMGLASLLWFYDSWARWLWWIGMVSYGFASYLCLLPLALFYRYTQRPRASYGIACAIALAAVHTIHPYSFFILVVPMGVLYGRRLSALSTRAHLGVLAIGAFTCAINAPWLIVAAEHWHYILDSAYYAQTGLEFLVSDFFDLLRSPTDTGVIGTRTGFRFLYLGLAVAALAKLRRDGDARYAVLAAGIGSAGALAYLGAYIPGAAQIQPYRHVLPMSMLAIVPAAWLIDALLRQRPLAALQPAARGGVYVAMVVAGQHLASQVLYFHSHALPKVIPPIHSLASPLHALGYPGVGYFAHETARHFSLPHPSQALPDTDRMVAWASRHIGMAGRALVEEPELGERLAWRSSVEVIGGFRERNIEHAHANIFRRYDGEVIPEEVMRDWLQTYGVGWVITRSEHPELAQMPQLLGTAQPIHHRWVLKVKIPTPRLSGSPGKVVAQTNKLSVSGTDPDADLILRYHFHEALRCQPKCTLRREPIEYDDVGLIRVPAPHPAKFVIENHYP